MARDRKRAKQRQQRQQRKAAQSARTRAPLAVEARTTTEPPEPVDEASADAEQAKVVAAAGDPEPELTDGAQQATEPDDEGELDASEAAPVDGGEPTRAGGNRFFNFLGACWAELQRVRWPDRRQVGQATGVVLGFVVIAGGYLGLMDAIFSRVVDAIL